MKEAKAEELPQIPQEPVLPDALQMRGRLEGTGTHFELNNSRYLNITLDSSEPIKLVLESVPEMVTMHIESASGVVSTKITLGGFAPQTTYHKYEDDYHNHVAFTTDANGRYNYAQDLSKPHLVFIQPRTSTIFLSDSGWSDPTVGTWDPVTRTATLTQDIMDAIQIDSDNIILDGNGHKITGSNTGYGVFSGRKGVTIMNLRVERFWRGIGLLSSNNNRLKVNNVSSNSNYGIFLSESSSNILEGNVVTNNHDGIVFIMSSKNNVTGNTLNLNNYYGLLLYMSSNNNKVAGNTVSRSSFGILLWWYCLNNSVVDNTVSNNSHGVPFWWYCDNNEVEGNIVSSNPWGGITLYGYCNNNNLTNNAVSNSGPGISLTSSSNNNKIYNNNFIDNPTQALVESSSGNIFNLDKPIGGNYWSDWTTPDNDGDGFVDNPYVFAGAQDNLPWAKPNGWLVTTSAITLTSSPATGEGFIKVDGVVVTTPAKFTWTIASTHTLEALSPVAGPTGTQYVWTSWSDGGDQTHTYTVPSVSETVTAHYKTQHYLTVISPYDTAGGEGWYDEGETAYAILQLGLEYGNDVVYGFVGWTRDASGWDLISNPILMDAPKTAIAKWEASSVYVYGDVRAAGFWKHEVNVWYFIEYQKATGIRLRGIGAAHGTEDELIACLMFIDSNSDYFRGKIVRDNDGNGIITNLEILENAYSILKTPTGPDSMKMRAEQQLLLVWLNLARKAFFWNTQLSQDTHYIYWQYTYDDINGLAKIGEAILFCEAELLKPDGNYEAAKTICDSINNNLGIIWGT
jgi:parallel beta-helix repeat protein